MIATGSNYLIWRNIKFTSAGAGVSAALLQTGIGCVVHQCYVTNPSTNAGAIAVTTGGTGCIVENCDLALTGASGGGQALTILSTDRAIANRIIDSQNIGILCSGAGNFIVLDNVFFAAVVGPAVDLTNTTVSNLLTARGNVIQGKALGIRIASAAFTSLYYFGDNMITDGTSGIVNATPASQHLPAWFSHNRFRDNTTDVGSDWADWKTGGSAGEVTTDTGTATSDYIDTTTDKYKLISTSPGWRASSVPGRDIGAMQHVEPTLPTASNVYTGTGTYGYADALVTPTKVVSSIANATAGNIKNGVTIGDVVGTFASGLIISNSLDGI